MEVQLVEFCGRRRYLYIFFSTAKGYSNTVEFIRVFICTESKKNGLPGCRSEGNPLKYLLFA